MDVQIARLTTQEAVFFLHRELNHTPNGRLFGIINASAEQFAAFAAETNVRVYDGPNLTEEQIRNILRSVLVEGGPSVVICSPNGRHLLPIDVIATWFFSNTTVWIEVG